MSIALHDVAKTFGDFPAVRGVSLAAEPGEFLALLGPSGSGKTTLLRLIAGLEFPDAGRVTFAGTDITGLSVKERGVGFVFQHYALFRHMTIADNVAFGLTVRKRRDRPSRAEISRRVEELLELVQLGGLGKRYPAQLSGGQRQRVALARALAVEPRLLLLDEPFGALDAKVRKELRSWLRALHDRMGLTSVFVTHDQEEALELADRVVVMNQGRIEQVARPRDLYDSPANAFVFDFVGDSNALPAVVAADGSISVVGHALPIPAPADLRGEARLYFRPHDVERVTEGPALPVVVEAIHPRGGQLRVDARIEGPSLPIEIETPRDAAIAPGSRIRIRPSRARLFPV